MAVNTEKDKKLVAVIRDRNALLFQGAVEAVSSFNDTGPFDILPQHQNFISLIKQAVILHLADKQEKRIELTLGVLKVSSDNVEIYLGIVR